MPPEPDPAEPPRTLRCQECPATSADGRALGWVAFLTRDDPPEIIIYCPICAEREFGEG
jgi:hypothetical protein